MKSAPFVMHQASSQANILDLLELYGEDARIIAGGQTLGGTRGGSRWCSFACPAVRHVAATDTRGKNGGNGTRQQRAGQPFDGFAVFFESLAAVPWGA